MLENVIATTLCDLNAELHPPWVLFNTTRIGPQGEFFLTEEELSGQRSPFSAIVMKAVDRERMTVMQALCLKPIEARELMSGTAAPETEEEKKKVEEIMKGFKERARAKGLEKRYLAEDIPYGLVTIASLGNMVGVKTPVIDAEIMFASLIHQTDYWRNGRTVEELGLDGLSIDEIQRFVTEG